MLRQILGIDKIERRLARLELRLDRLEGSDKIDNIYRRLEALEKKKLRPETLSRYKKMVLDTMKGSVTTSQIAERLNWSRSWASTILNRLEKEGKVRESGKKGRELLYERT